jgi:hypothetical protein
MRLSMTALMTHSTHDVRLAGDHIAYLAFSNSMADSNDLPRELVA